MHGNRFTFRQDSNPSCCVISAIPNLGLRYVIEITKPIERPVTFV
jgi:hypothetical protein